MINLEIIWLGHSCFRIKGKEATVITDPCNPSFGYSPGELRADIVTLSHLHPGHCYVEGISGEFDVIEGPGEYEIKGVFITGIGTFHDSENGENRGKNTVYLLDIDGIVLCHLGDLGHALTSGLIEDIGGIEVLFVPVGGVSTISSSVAVEIVRHLTPTIVIPMHYKTPASVGDFEPVDKFLKELGAGEVVSRPKLSVTRSSLPNSTQVMLLDYPRK